MSSTFTIGGDLKINRLGYGAMRITGKGIWGEPKDPAEARRVLRRAWDLGVSFIDTADSYGPEVSERLIAEALHPYPKGLVIATKGGLTRQGPNQWLPVGRPEYLRQCVEMSLRRLRVDRIDLYQLHRFDEKVPVEESLGALKALQHAGKIHHIGISEVSVADIKRARKLVKVVSVQNRYNASDRAHEPVVDYCEKEGLAFIPWFPVAAGELTRPGGPMDQLAKKHAATVAQLALAWLLHRSKVMIPIPGTSSVKHLKENVLAADLEIEDAEWAEIDGAKKESKAMKRPYVVCHMMGTVDGRIQGDRWSLSAAAEAQYEAVHALHRADAWMCGRQTFQGDFLEQARNAAFSRTARVPPGDFFPETHFAPAGGRKGKLVYALAVDAGGKLRWPSNDMRRDRLVVLTSLRAPAGYLADLRKKSIAYVLGGGAEIDFGVVLRKLHSRLGIRKVMLEGGGSINGALLAAGLIDELSLLICPFADGSRRQPTVFDAPEAKLKKKATALRLLAAKPRPGGILWLRYKVQK